MAGETAPRRTLSQIISEWYLDYCIYQLWKEFKEKRSLSACWRDAIQGKAMGQHSTVFQTRSAHSCCFNTPEQLVRLSLNISYYFLQIFWKIDGLI